MMLSDVCLSVAYIGPKSRTERPRKTEIGTKVAHVTRDSNTTFKVNNNNNNNNTSICKAHNVSIRAESEAPAIARWIGWLEG